MKTTLPYTKNVDKYLPLHKKTFTIKGERFQIHAEKTLAIYPYKHWQTRVDVENLTTASAYRFESMENEETFCKFSDKLEKMLSTAIAGNCGKNGGKVAKK